MINLNNFMRFYDKNEEYYNEIVSNINLFYSEKKIIAVTSLNKSEGKSTVGLCLAMSLAKIRKKVIFIRLSIKGSNSNKNNKDYEDLFEKNITNGEINDTSIENLYICCIKYNKEFIINEIDLFNNMLLELEKNYNYIIIDCPALKNSVESNQIIKNIKNMILVLESNKMYKKDFIKFIKKIEKIDVNLLGIILNKLRCF